jgi:hypothetical protein
MADYAELLHSLQPDELFIECAYLINGEMPREKYVAKIYVNQKIKKASRNAFANQTKKKYDVDRVQFVSIEL